MASAAYIKNWYHNRMSEAKAFLGNRCVDCGTTEELDFDHIDPSQKSFTITMGWNKRKDVFWNEVKKCQLLCRPCHITKTYIDLQQAARGTHGTVSSYKWCGPPKCEECKRAKREVQRAWRLKKKLNLP